MRVLDLAEECGVVPLRLHRVHGDDPAGQVQALDGRGGARGSRSSSRRLPAGPSRGPRPRERPTAGGPGCRQAGSRRGRSCRPRRPAAAGPPRQASRACAAARRCSRSCRAASGSASGAACGTGGEVAVHRVVEGRRVGLAEDAAEGALAGRPHRPVHGSRPPAQGGQGLLGAAGRPVRDRRRRVMPGSGERAHRQGQHELQRVPAAQRRARVRNPAASSAGRGGRDRQRREAADRPSRGTSVREDSSAGTVLSGRLDGWYLRSSGTVPACQNAHPAREATAL